MSKNYWKMFALDFAHLLMVASDQFDFESLTSPSDLASIEPASDKDQAEFREFVNQVLTEARTMVLTDESGED